MNKKTKNIFFLLASFAIILTGWSCTKEGIQGPKGPDGQPGANGTGTGGVATRIITYDFKSTTFSWELTGTISLHKRYRLKYSTPSSAGYTFTLPDSVTQYIDEGGLLAYANINNTSQTWWQLGFMPVNFYDYEGYGYTTQKVPGVGYRFSVIAFDIPHPDRFIFNTIRFAVIPKTSSELLMGH